MMCKHPFIRQRPYPGWDRNDMDTRLAATPLPCGRCLPCRINKRRMWTLRILLEESVHAESVFVTLTFNDESYPSDGCVYPKTLRNFINRLRYRIGTFRYFGVGEYGGTNGRAHYHVILFGVSRLYERKIHQAWNFRKDDIGFTYFGDVNDKTASYIAGYTTKKLTKEGEPALGGKCPEFMRSSRKNGGIGAKAIIEIGKKLKQNPYFEKRIINELKYGSKQYPLGAYLTGKLSDVLEIPEKEKREHLWRYQEGLLIAHYDLDGIDYELNIVKEKEEKRLQQMKRMQIFKQRRIIK